MVIGGEWTLFDDGVMRPIIHGNIFLGEDSWLRVPFLVDTGADKTVFNASTLFKLNLPYLETEIEIGGVGGLANSVTVETKIQFTKENGKQVVFRGKYVALTELEALDFCVLGHDILENFAIIVDQPNKIVVLVTQNHYYEIKSR